MPGGTAVAWLWPLHSTHTERVESSERTRDVVGLSPCGSSSRNVGWVCVPCRDVPALRVLGYHHLQETTIALGQGQ
eukprot:1687171-Rhodomonas_salina.1